MNLKPSAQLNRRHRQERIARTLMTAMSWSIVAVLLLILWRVIGAGTVAFDASFWSTEYTPQSQAFNATTDNANDLASGVFDSIIYSVIMLAVTMIFAVPISLMAGIYLHEYARVGKVTNAIRMAVSNLAAVPSIVWGLLGLAIFVRFLDLGKNPLASGLTLGILVLPILIVSTEEALKTIPKEVRHASLALGANRWQTIKSHVVPYAMPNILTGQIVALARAAGETAPLLLLGAGSFRALVQYGLLEPGAALQTRAYKLILGAHEVDKVTGAGAIVILLIVTLTLNLTAIILRQRLASKIKW
jgi:phosphate transport system permease protein